MTISHFTAVLLFAALASVVFAITLRESLRDQVRYGLESFVWFVGGTILGGWILYFINPH